MKVEHLNHPCFSKKAHLRFGRVHLPVAPKCNIQCRYCVRKYDCVNESRPGVTSKILSPSEAIERVSALLNRDDNIRVVGIAGPGDALANESTFIVLEKIGKMFPDINLCLSTNGVYLLENIERLKKIGIRYLTITINATTIGVAQQIYKWVVIDNKLYKGKDCAEIILKKQWLGLKEAANKGFYIKVNTVYIPGVNDIEIPMIAYLCGKKGVHSMNIIPLIPQAEFSHIEPPNKQKINLMRAACSKYVAQMSHCSQCRSDACGKLSENKDIELEALNQAIGEEYCEMIL